MLRALSGIEKEEIERRTSSSDIPVPAIHIPTDDPAAALRFCRRLAGMMDDALELASAGRLGAGQQTLDPGSPAPELSVVMPVLNEQENLLALHTRLSSVLKETRLSYEIIFVDDGSRDGSL